MSRSGVGFAGRPATAGDTLAPADAGRLTYQRCRWCHTAYFRRLLCPVCASSDVEEVVSDGPGVVVRSSVVRHFTGERHNESLVRFAEGFLLRCRVVGVPPQMVWVGAQVRPVPDADPAAGDPVFELCDPETGVTWH